MKKNYETPVIDKISFNYKEQVVAASGDSGGGFEYQIFSAGCYVQNLIVMGYDVCSHLPFEE